MITFQDPGVEVWSAPGCARSAETTDPPAARSYRRTALAALAACTAGTHGTAADRHRVFCRQRQLFPRVMRAEVTVSAASTEQLDFTCRGVLINNPHPHPPSHVGPARLPPATMEYPPARVDPHIQSGPATPSFTHETAMTLSASGRPASTCTREEHCLTALAETPATSRSSSPTSRLLTSQTQPVRESPEVIGSTEVSTAPATSTPDTHIGLEPPSDQANAVPADETSTASASEPLQLAPFLVHPKHPGDLWATEHTQPNQWLNMFFGTFQHRGGRPLIADLSVAAALSVFNSINSMRTPEDVVNFLASVHNPCLSSCPDMTRYYAIVASMWCSQIQYDAQYATRDVFHHALKFWQIVAFFFMGASSTSHWDVNALAETGRASANETKEGKVGYSGVFAFPIAVYVIHRVTLVTQYAISKWSPVRPRWCY